MAATSGTAVWVNGTLGTAGETHLSALDHGLTTGDGVFETCAVHDSQVFALTRHLRRLNRSAELMRLRTPDDSLIREAVAETVAAAGPMLLGRVRITVTAGVGPLGSDRGPGAPTLVVAATPIGAWPADPVVVTVPWTRNERSAVAGVKTTSYADNVVALDEAHRRGAHEALLANTRGELCEGTGSNVVVALGGQLLTPPLSSGCLAGITRELLLEWAGRNGPEIIEKDLPFEVLAEAEDVLLTSSTRGVQRQVAVDGRALPGSTVGDAAAALYAHRAAQVVDP